MEVEEKFIRYFENMNRYGFDVFRYNASYGLDMNQFKGKTVLDIGCGDGLKTLFYAIFGKAKHVLGIDNYLGHGSAMDNQIAFKKHIDYLGVKNVEVIVDDFLTHSFPDDSMDIVCASDTLHHLYFSKKRASLSKEVFSNYHNILSKIYRLLKPGGLMCLRESQKYSLHRWIPLWKNEIEWSDKQMAGDWVTLLRATGFQAVTLYYYVPYKLRQFRAFLNNPVANFFLKSVYTIISIKP